MKKLTNTAILVNLFLLCASSFSQVKVENNWINNEQIYYKLKVSTEGIFKVTRQELVQAGMEVTNVNPINFQLYHHGKELAFKLIGEEDGSFDAQDYLLFYAKPNNGVQDSLVYRPASARMNKYHSMYSDNTYYYLTVGNAAGKRMVFEKVYSDDNIPEESYHLEEKLILNTQKYTFNDFVGLPSKLKQSYYVAGEGRSGNKISTLVENIDHITLSNLFNAQSSPKPILEVNTNGRSFGYKKVQLSIRNSELRDLTPFFISDFNQIIHKGELEWSDFDSANSFSLITKCTSAEANQFCSITHIKIVYPQSFDMQSVRQKTFFLQPSVSENSKINIKSSDSLQYALNVTDFYNPVSLNFDKVNDGVQLILSRKNTKEQLFLSSNTHQVSEVSIFLPIELIQEKKNFLIVTHPSLRSSAEQYAHYRSSEQGGSYKVQVETITNLYDNFTFGEKNPMAIRKYLSFLLQNNHFPENLFIIGSSYSASDSLKLKENIDLVPTVGYPGSDVLLSAGLNGYSKDVQSIPTGRINATNNQQVLDYLVKVIEFEHPDFTVAASKNILHLNGGNTTYQIDYFKQVLNNNAQRIVNEDSTFKFEAIQKTNPAIYENVNIAEQLNKGVKMLTFLGHATPTRPDVNIGFVSNTTLGYQNKGKYPFMYFVGCRVGDIFNYYNTIGSDWIFTPEKGSVAVLSNSYFAFQGYVEPYLEEFYKNLLSHNKYKKVSIGQAIQQSSKYTAGTQYGTFPFQIAHLHQTILQGDPSLKLYVEPTIDVVLKSEKETCIDKDLTIKIKANSQAAPYVFDYSFNDVFGQILSDSLGMANVSINNKSLGINTFILEGVRSAKGMLDVNFLNKSIKINVTEPGLSLDKDAASCEIQTTIHADLYCEGSCRIAASILSVGASPVHGKVNSQVFIENQIINAAGKSYLQRHYDIEPVLNATTATAKITLYFLQSEFDAFNENARSKGLPLLPSYNATDQSAKKHLKILQIHGESDGTGYGIENYHGEKVEISPAENDIVWNAQEQRWEVSFMVQGFSAFFVTTRPLAAPLGVSLVDFKVKKVEGKNKISWSVADVEKNTYFDLERSISVTVGSKNQFESIQNFVGNQIEFTHIDSENSNAAIVYYRLKIVNEQNGSVTFSKIIKIENNEKDDEVQLIFSNPIDNNDEVKVLNKENLLELELISFSGLKIKKYKLNDKVNLFGINQGGYIFKVVQKKGKISFYKVIKK
ncbi:MAG: hypothetical protein KA327_02055 [Pseudarcicella sp.]|nr:hypothetical protein [Pseudarcicella sp.]